ncbi:MAG: MBL fold metallo-hydrolase [Rhodocyclaceae bacterium]|nr:MBL fold metallo-hydrolase [Rhodocyclaceae bacterium]
MTVAPMPALRTQICAPNPDGLLLEVLPADEGDCLLLTCRRGADVHHVLIDGGTPATAPRLAGRLAEIPGGRVELLVVTHVDADHIGGIVRLLDDPAFALEIGEVWFNGYRHLPGHAPRPRGFRDGEGLVDILTGGEGGRVLPWNEAFGGAAVMREDGEGFTLPEVQFNWGLRLTLLSPTPERLGALGRDWQKYLDALHRAEHSAQTPQPRVPSARGEDLEAMAMTPSRDDSAKPNGSSIALLAEFGGRSAVLAGDAFPDVLAAALSRLAELRGHGVDVPLPVDVFKLPHHGSQANVTLPLLAAVKAEHYVFSTSGARFRHPDQAAVARVITRGGPDHTLWFNYANTRTRRWDKAEWKASHAYRTRYPEQAGRGVTLFLPAKD